VDGITGIHYIMRGGMGIEWGRISAFFFHPDRAWTRSSKTCMKYTIAECTYRTPDDGQRGCQKHVEFYDRINLDN
jgi:hypothetical protein